ncbi:sigma-70 family RNA polymerase sigma factor [Streptomyces anthocyanicus]|uniref:Sigma-70 family RNA polymerase sigma factor n=1 Tax=Streptomyces rubrogriseus TaxID=194673 RepID=A0A6G3TQV9_9ACTN|nr:sigma-70 family RNA polymerase sigma factor [Streptomyces rubrogriseus]NEC39117.1 sigma-70 family RNA polymerase sigma factor [Streptomyces rubrogriseus]
MIEQLKRADSARIGMISDEDPRARAERQRAEDAVLVERLGRAGFRGPEMALTQERLWAYATVTLNAWCSNLKIVEHVRASTPAHAEFDIAARHGDVLRTDPQERIDLVLTAVSGAWPAFFTHALQEGGWNARWKPEGSEPAVGRRPSAAGLRTYFTRGVLQSFPRHYRRWCLQRDRRLAELGVMEDWAVDLMHWWTGTSPFEDESMLVHAWLNGFLASLPAHKRHMLRMVYEGYSYAEIGETLGITAKMVTDRIYRLHRRLRERRELLRKQYLMGHHPDASADDRMAAALQQRAQQARQTGAQR